MRSSAAHSRRFGYAVAISLVVHAVALYGGWPLLRDSLEEPVPPPPLVTRLVELPKPAPEPASAPPEEVKKPVPLPGAKKTEPVKPLPLPVPPTAEAPPLPAQAPPVAAAPAAPAAEPVAPPQADTRAAEAATAAQYRLQLIAYAQRHKPPYPSLARGLTVRTTQPAAARIWW